MKYSKVCLTKLNSISFQVTKMYINLKRYWPFVAHRTATLKANLHPQPMKAPH